MQYRLLHVDLSYLDVFMDIFTLFYIFTSRCLFQQCFRPTELRTCALSFYAVSSEFVSHIQWVYTEFDSTLISIFEILTKDNTRILLEHFYISQNFTVFYIYIVEDINFVCKRY